MALHVIGRRGQLSLGVAHFDVLSHASGQLGQGEDPLLSSHVRCRVAGERLGGDCLTCGHLVAWRADAKGAMEVDCSFCDSDFVTMCMTPASRLVTIDGGRDASEARALLEETGKKRLIVTDHDALAGIVAAVDLGREGRVSDLMSREVIAIEPTATLGEAAAALRALAIGCLPVVSDRVVAGLLTRGDLRRIGVPDRLLR
jgi:CBS domain-containing protein